MGPVAPRHVGSSQTRARTRVPCISRQILNHCATTEAPALSSLTVWRRGRAICRPGLQANATVSPRGNIAAQSSSPCSAFPALCQARGSQLAFLLKVTSDLPVTQSTDIYVAPVCLRHCAEMKDASFVLPETGKKARQPTGTKELEPHHDSWAGAGATLLTQGRRWAQNGLLEQGAQLESYRTRTRRRRTEAAHRQRPRGGKLHVGRKRKSTRHLRDKVTLKARAPPGNSRGKRK